jgi:signal transduction histidine kinase
VLRLYANDLVIDNAMLRLEEAVQAQTNMLAEANNENELANRKIVDQAQKQLKHFAMMSHEIRTPLNCIVGISNLILDSCEDDTMKESIEMITSSGDLLLAVVDDVLDYSKLASGKVETKIAPTKLSVPVNTVATAIRTKALENRVELRTHYSPDLPEFVVTDARRLQQILYNLLGNAAKFGSTGKYIDFSIVLEPTDRGFLRFSIKDYGKGIAPEEKNNM